MLGDSFNYDIMLCQLNELCDSAIRTNWWENNHWDDPPDHINWGFVDDTNYAKYMFQVLDESNDFVDEYILSLPPPAMGVPITHK